MAWTQTDIETLEKAIASGTLSVTFSGPPARSITYQNIDAMFKILAVMKQQVNGGATAFRLGATRKGLGS